MGWTHDFAPEHPYHAVVDAALADGAPPPPYPICPTMATLADLYDPTTMPPALTKAHADLDRAVDRCYRKDPFPNDRARVEHLFALYETLTAPLAPTAKKATRKKAQNPEPS